MNMGRSVLRFSFVRLRLCGWTRYEGRGRGKGLAVGEEEGGRPWTGLQQVEKMYIEALGFDAWTSKARRRDLSSNPTQASSSFPPREREACSPLEYDGREDHRLEQTSECRVPVHPILVRERDTYTNTRCFLIERVPSPFGD